MKNPRKLYCNILGYIGETFVMYELAKRGIRCQKMDGEVADYDLLTEFGDRIEVKSARPIWAWNGQHTGKTLMWGFNNYKNHYVFGDGGYKYERSARDRQCDFFIFLGLNEDLTVKDIFIVPKKIVEVRQIINEPVKRKRKRKDITICISDFKDKWELLKTTENR